MGFLDWIQAIFVFIVTSLMALFWADTRRRTERTEEECEDRLKSLREDLTDGYLKKTDHTILCQNAVLRVEKKIDELKYDIQKEFNLRNGLKK
jgi:hypothetical protein